MHKVSFSIIIVFISLWSTGQDRVVRNLFPEMPTQQFFSFKFKNDKYVNTKNKYNSKYEIYIGSEPFFNENSIDYYLFYIKNVKSCYTDTLLLSLRNDTLYVSARKVTSKTSSHRSNLTLNNMKTLPLLDLKEYRIIKREYRDTHMYWFDCFGYSIEYEMDSISYTSNDVYFNISTKYELFNESIKKMFFSEKKGIYNIDVY